MISLVAFNCISPIKSLCFDHCVVEVMPAFNFQRSGLIRGAGERDGL